MTKTARGLLLLSGLILTCANAMASHTYSLITLTDTGGENVHFATSNLQSNGNITVTSHNGGVANGVLIAYPNDKSIASSNHLKFTLTYNNQSCDLSFSGSELMPKYNATTENSTASSFCCPGMKDVELMVVGFKDFPVTIPDSIFYDNKDLNDIYGDTIIDSIPLKNIRMKEYKNQC